MVQSYHSTPVSSDRLPLKASPRKVQAAHSLEVNVARHNAESMLASQGSDPGVIISPGGFLAYGQQFE